MTPVRDSSRLLVALVALVATAGAPAIAADSSDWAIDIRSAVRLIAASAAPGATQYRAAVELRTDPGWHTYWRYPGDSGVPPLIEFVESENVRTAKVLYPAPHAFTDESGTSIGYRDHVTFPVLVTPRDPKKPVLLKLHAEYAVCEKLCVPAAGYAALTLGGSSSYDSRIDKALASVPKIVTPQEAGLSARRVNGGPKPLVAVDLVSAGIEPVEIFVEGPTADWALPIPKPAQGAPAGHRQFGFELDGLPPGADPKGPLELTFTIVSGDRAVQTTTRLD